MLPSEALGSDGAMLKSGVVVLRSGIAAQAVLLRSDDSGDEMVASTVYALGQDRA